MSHGLSGPLICFRHPEVVPEAELAVERQGHLPLPQVAQDAPVGAGDLELAAVDVQDGTCGRIRRKNRKEIRDRGRGRQTKMLKRQASLEQLQS